MALAFFLGCSLLQLLILGSNATLGYVPVLVIHGTLILVAFSAHRLCGKMPAAPKAEAVQDSAQVGWVFWFFLLLATIHLSLAAIEVVHRPVFPWDAWLNWIYRAKAWFYAGGIVPIDSPQQWLSENSEALHNVAGAHYPSLLPITAVWIALHLGHWSETLVNLPTIPCGIALAGGVYGLCREAERSPAASMVAAYLVLSIPLIGTHLSLAGQADIWMAGYAGLGVSACLLGLVKKTSSVFYLGLLLTALSIGVKAEGGVWLALALTVGALTWLLAPRNRASLLTLAAILLLLGISGIRFVELPLLGAVGFRDGVLHVSFLGSHALERHDILHHYWQNFFLGGSWHLLWPLLLLAVLATWRTHDPRTRRIILAFLCMFVASQWMIFGITEQGRWAEDGTAINRIPLHLAPALVFCIALVAPCGKRSGSHQTAAVALIAAASALIITGGITLGYLGLQSSGEQGELTKITAAEQRLVMGEGELRKGERDITRFDNNVALVSSGPIRIKADSASLVSITTGGKNRNGQNFFWRTASDPQNLKMSQYEGRGTTYLRLQDNAEWTGDVTEIGLVFYDDEGSLSVGDIVVRPDSLSSRVGQAMTEWTQMVPWLQKSLNALPAGAPDSLVPLTPVVTGWLAVMLAIVAIRSHKSRSSAFHSAVAVCLIAWLVLDLRWIANRGMNTLDTVSAHAPGNSDPLRIGGDRMIRQVVEAATNRLPENDTALLITADDTRMRYQILRAKYHALPHAAYAHEPTRDSLPVTDRTDHLLVLKQPHRDPAAPPTTATEWQAFLAGRGERYQIVWESSRGFLLGRAPGG